MWSIHKPFDMIANRNVWHIVWARACVCAAIIIILKSRKNRAKERQIWTSMGSAKWIECREGSITTTIDNNQQSQPHTISNVSENIIYKLQSRETRKRTRDIPQWNGKHKTNSRNNCVRMCKLQINKNNIPFECVCVYVCENTIIKCIIIISSLFIEANLRRHTHTFHSFPPFSLLLPLMICQCNADWNGIGTMHTDKHLRMCVLHSICTIEIVYVLLRATTPPLQAHQTNDNNKLKSFIIGFGHFGGWAAAIGEFGIQKQIEFSFHIGEFHTQIHLMNYWL